MLPATHSLEMRLRTNTAAQDDLESLGFRFGDRGTHTSRTMMLDELRATLAAVSEGARRADYVAAIVEHNCLGKPTASTRVLTSQRLSELYALIPTCRFSASCDRSGHSTSAGNPRLRFSSRSRATPYLRRRLRRWWHCERATSFARGPMRQALREAVVGDRLSDETLDKVARNSRELLEPGRASDGPKPQVPPTGRADVHGRGPRPLAGLHERQPIRGAARPTGSRRSIVSLRRRARLRWRRGGTA